MCARRLFSVRRFHCISRDRAIVSCVPNRKFADKGSTISFASRSTFSIIISKYFLFPSTDKNNWLDTLYFGFDNHVFCMHQTVSIVAREN